MTRVAAIVQARMTSTRLPEKVLKPLAGAPLVIRMLERVKRIKGVDVVAAAIPTGAVHDPLVDVIGKHLPDVICARGPEEDVLARTIVAARHCKADVIMRITSDCPMVDPDISQAVLCAYQGANADYARLHMSHGFPLGYDTEVLSAELLYAIPANNPDVYEREHVTPYIWRRPEEFRQIILDSEPDLRTWRLVVDTPDDLKLAQAIYERLYTTKPDFRHNDLISLFKNEPELLNLNAKSVQNAYISLGGAKTYSSTDP